MSTTEIDRIKHLPCWPSPPEIARIPQGMSNHNFVVRCGDESYFARIPLSNPAVIVDRPTEIRVTLAAEAAGLSPPVHYVGDGVMVTRFLANAETLTARSIMAPGVLARVIDLVKACHHELPKHLEGELPTFSIGGAIRQYQSTLVEHGARRVGDVPRWMSILQRLESAFGDCPQVFGHNDLLPANVLDDGERLWLIDWEYAGLNNPYFDIGALIGNFELDDEAAKRVIHSYFGDEGGDTKLRFEIMTCATFMREFMWSLVAEDHSDVAFDYATYSEDFIERFEAAWRRLEPQL